MKTEKFEGICKNAYGAPLKTPVKFSGSYEAYQYPPAAKHTSLVLPKLEGLEELANDDVPTVADLYDMVNAKNKANERQKAMTEALDAAGIQKPDPNSPEQIRKDLIAGFVRGGVSEEIATRQVDALLKQAKAVA